MADNQPAHGLDEGPISDAANDVQAEDLPLTEEVSATSADEMAVTTEEQAVSAEELDASAEDLGVTAELIVETAEEVVETAEDPAVTPGEPAVTPEEPAVTSEEPAVTSEEPAVTSEELAVTAGEPGVAEPGLEPDTAKDLTSGHVAPTEDGTETPVGEQTSKSRSRSRSRRKRKGSTSFSRQTRAGKTKKQSEPSSVGHVVEDYWEIEAIEDFRRISKRQKKGAPSVYEFKVKWKGYEERTWEPEENLTEVALIDARRLVNKQAEMELGLQNGDATPAPDAKEDPGWFENDAVVVELPTPAKKDASYDPKRHFEDTHWNWSDQGQILFRTIERISVNDPNARQIVTERRQNGIPIVLTGHVGWAQFAKPWLVEESVPVEATSNEEITTEPNEIKQEEETFIDAEQDEIKLEEAISPPIDSENSALPEANQLETKCVSDDSNDDSRPPMASDLEASASQPPVASDLEASAMSETAMEVDAIEDADSPEELLDLSKPHYVDVAKMIADIGNERVPIIKKHYNERNPLTSELTLEAFIKKCWPTREEMNGTAPMRKLPDLYLHQWQFPASDTAVAKLCGPGKNNPIPHHILGEDLLKYWWDKQKWGQDNYYQYLFMGRAGTRSKLHRDPGGLLISIAPIVGIKEVTLVHRSDGPSCLYHLDADIHRPDLHRFPMMYSVRAWKSELKPGEILLMPYGTYHACRNVTPCLSYHRFYLDTVNLKGFLESFFDLEAPCMDHDQVIWNVCWELSERVDKFSEQAESSGDPVVPYEIEAAVDALRVLRNISREIAMREAIKEKQQGKKIVVEEKYQWTTLVEDIDQSLHDFRFRLRKKKPPLFTRKSQKEPAANYKKTTSQDEEEEFDDDEAEDKPARTTLEREYRKLPKVTKAIIGLGVPDSLKLGEGDKIRFRWHGRQATGTIDGIQDFVKAAYLTYDGFPPCHSEYQPIDRLRIHVSGDSTEVSDKDLQAGSRVFHAEEGGEEYRAVVQSWKKGTFYLVHLHLDGGRNFVSKQWVTRDCIFERVSSADNSLPMKAESGSTPKSKQLSQLFDESAPADAIPPTLLDLEQNENLPPQSGTDETIDIGESDGKVENMDVEKGEEMESGSTPKSKESAPADAIQPTLLGLEQIENFPSQSGTDETTDIGESEGKVEHMDVEKGEEFDIDKSEEICETNNGETNEN